MMFFVQVSNKKMTLILAKQIADKGQVELKVFERFLDIIRMTTIILLDKRRWLRMMFLEMKS